MTASTIEAIYKLGLGTILAVILVLTPIIIISQLRFLLVPLTDLSLFVDIETEKLESEFNSTIDYISPPFNTSLDEEFFSTEDVLHMQDVRTIFVILYFAVIIGIILLASAITIESNSTIRVLKSGLVVYQGFLIAVTIVSLLAIPFWDALFRIFHQVLFYANTYWLLDPTTSNLIKFLPDRLFQTLLTVLVGMWIGVWVILKILIKNMHVNIKSR